MEFSTPITKKHYEDLDLHSQIQDRIENTFQEIDLVAFIRGANRDKYREWKDIDSWVSVHGKLKSHVSIRGLTVGMEIVYVNLETNRVELYVHNGKEEE